jgi:5-methyltetrahydrofolate--homocysteine methyltransferase
MKYSLEQLIQQKILILDGAMGTMIQKHKLQENDYRGDSFKDHPKPQKGNNDLLSITNPGIIKGIHREYLEAGADIITTNSFNSNRISMSDYGMEDNVYNMNFQSARIPGNRWNILLPEHLARQTVLHQCRQMLMTREQER